MAKYKNNIMNVLNNVENFLKKHEILIHGLYVVSLFCFYFFPILNIYGYEYTNNISLMSITISIVLSSLTIYAFKKLSGDNHFILLITVVIAFQIAYPEYVYYAFNNSSLVVPITSLLTIVALLVMSKKVKMKQQRNNQVPYLITVVLTILISLPFLQYLPYINLRNLLLQDIYETRAIFNFISTRTTVYLIAPLTRVLLPIVIAQSLKRKNYGFTGLFIVIYAYIYLCGAFRSVLLGLFATALFYFGNYEKKKIWYMGLMLLGITLSIMTFLPFVRIATILYRRLLFVPPGMNNHYVRTFANNPTLFAHSGLTLGLLNNPYGSLPIYVGEEVLGIPGLSANVGLFVEGFVGFGYAGVLVSVAMISLIVYIFNEIKVPVEYFGVVFVFIYYLNNSLISTLLLTHGLFFMIIFFLIINCEKLINIKNPVIKKMFEK